MSREFIEVLYSFHLHVREGAMSNLKHFVGTVCSALHSGRGGWTRVITVAYRRLETCVGLDFYLNPSQPPESALYAFLAVLRVYLF